MLKKIFDFMRKKYFTYQIALITFIFFIILIASVSIVKYHFIGGKKFIFLQNATLVLADIPFRLKDIIKNRSVNLNKPPKLQKHKDKKKFKQFIANKRNALLVLSRYDHSFSRSFIDIIDLKNFKVIHSYSNDINEVVKKTRDTYNYTDFDTYHNPIRFLYRHPLLLENGSIITNAGGPLFKIDFCSNLKWINDKGKFHHSTNLDHEENIWQVGETMPQSKYIENFKLKNFLDFFIIKLNTDGKILYKKSTLDILIENNLLPENFALFSATKDNLSPIHLNDIEPAFYDSKYWKVGDLFLSLRNINSIIHYRPITNKVINYITGPFDHQHDVDIISEKEISIFNNNIWNEKALSQVLIYNFETKEFKKMFNDQLRNENFRTDTNGLSHIFNDGALLVEEQNHGRIILFNKNGQKEWEFINKDKNGDIGLVKWVRVIEDEIFIEKIISLVKNKTCTN